VRYIPALDGLRAVAVMLVFLFHRGGPRFAGGWVGVDIFFVLSGYLITTMLIEEYQRTGGIQIGSFYSRRAWRLLPALIIVVVAAMGLAAWFNAHLADTERDAVAALFYFSDYRHAFGNAPTTSLSHMWSLSVEEQFYLIWPVLLLSMLPRRRPFALRVTLVLIVVVAIWREYLILTSPDAFRRTYFAFDTRADELLLGCALALWQPQVATVRAVRHFWPVAVVLIVAATRFFSLRNRSLQLTEAIGFPLISTAAAYLIALLTIESDIWLTRLLSLPPIAGFGRISYGFYLWHWVIISEQNHLRIDNIWLVFSFSAAAAAASYVMVERPLRALGRRRWTMRRLQPRAR
jgi:peptidoglycan/LPS O-acetylase OafA/YrhL